MRPPQTEVAVEFAEKKPRIAHNVSLRGSRAGITPKRAPRAIVWQSAPELREPCIAGVSELLKESIALPV